MRRQQHGRAALNGFDHLGLKRIEFEIEFGGDGGKADIAIKSGQQPALAGALLKNGGIGGKILTHEDAR